MNTAVSCVLSSIFWGNVMVLFLYLLCQMPSVFQKTDCRHFIGMSEVIFLRFLFPAYGIFTVPSRMVEFIQSGRVTFFGHTFSLICLLLFVWLSGTCILLLRLIWKYVWFRSAINAFLHSSSVSPLTTFLCRIPKNLTIYESTAVSVPMLTGILKPVILLPKIPLTSEELTLILEHELQHYKHKDIPLKVGMELFCILYWWNPFLSILKKQMLLLLEIRADLRVYEKQNEIKKIEYLRCLQLLSGYRTMYPAYGIHFTKGKKSFLLLRARYLIAENRQQKPPVIVFILFFLLFFCSFTLTFVPANILH